MILKTKFYPLKFEKVSFIKFDNWPVNWLEETDPGELLLGEGGRFGLLCLSDSGAFLTLTYGQLAKQDEIPWPDGGSLIGSLILVGDTLKIKLKGV